MALFHPHRQWAAPRASGRARPPSAIGGASSTPSVAARRARPSSVIAAAAGNGAARAMPSASHRCRTTTCCRPRMTTTATQAAAASAASATAPAPSSDDQTTFPALLACPICHSTPFALPASDPYARDCPCPRCGRTFLVSRGNGPASASSSYVDLTLTSGAQPTVFEQKSWVGTELFRTEAVSSIYERGWRQGFARAGFPGPQREFDLAMRYLAPVLSGGEDAAAASRPVLVDASCGTGLFTRLFARSGEFSGVVALDYSETMLRETRRLLAASSPPPATPVVAVRADIARLPFATGSVRAIHAGAALHCWPQPSAAMAEISRVLAPGGVFVASTFLTPWAPLGAVVGDAAVRPLARLSNPFGLSSSFRAWEEAELVDLCREVGLVGYERTRDQAFILFAARKPAMA